MCRRWAMPVYVVGVPAPFGRRETQMKWVDPDPKFDQTDPVGRRRARAGIVPARADQAQLLRLARGRRADRLGLWALCPHAAVL